MLIVGFFLFSLVVVLFILALVREDCNFSYTVSRACIAYLANEDFENQSTLFLASIIYI